MMHRVAETSTRLFAGDVYLGVVCNHLNLDSHVVLPQMGNTDASPQRLVIGHPLSEVANHRLESLVVDRYVVRVDPVDLGV